MATVVSEQTGYIPFKGHRTWYRIVGEQTGPEKLPLLCLHGGPAALHNYLESISAMAETGRQVIFYDQLGCGNSDITDDPSLWTVETFVDEVGVVREALGLDRVHLLGQSWGGMLAMEYMLTKPDGVASLIVADSLVSATQWAEEAEKLRAELPHENLAVLEKCEAEGTIFTDEYSNAADLYNSRHVCRLEQLPDYVIYSFENMNRNIYWHMWGPAEFKPTGTLIDWDISDRLGEIDTPTLILSGRHDESTPAINETIQRGIRNSEWVIFEESAHLPHAEEPERYMEVLGDFLARVESR